MARKYTHVLELMKKKGGRVDVTDPELASLLGRLMYRLPSYMSNIRKRANLEVRAVRNGRQVVSYELVAATAGDETTAATPAVEQSPAATA